MKHVCLLAMATALSLFAKGGTGRCTNTNNNVSFTILDNNPGITSDGGGAYLDQTGSTVLARLNCNGQSAELSGIGTTGSRHAFLNLANAPFNQADIGFFNIPFGNCFTFAETDTAANTGSAGSCGQFYTYLKVMTSANSVAYFFNMENQQSDTVGGLNAPLSGINNGCETSQVQVTYYPAGAYPGPSPTPLVAPPVSSNTGAPATWYVAPIPSISGCSGYPGALYAGQTNNKGFVGHFDSPFVIVIQYTK